MLMLNIHRIKHQLQLLRADGGLDNRPDFLQQLRQMHRLLHNPHLAAFDTAHIQHIIDKRQQMFAGNADFLQIILQQLRLIYMRSSQRRKADNRIHRRADIVRHTVEELRFGYISLLRCCQRRRQLLAALMVCQHQIIDIFIAHDKVAAVTIFINKSIAYLEILHFALIMSAIDNIIDRLLSDFRQHCFVPRFFVKLRPVILMDTHPLIILHALRIGRFLLHKANNFFDKYICVCILISSDEFALILNQPHARILTR